MNLIKCKSCGNMIAKTADFCPNCGGKVKKPMGCGKVGCLIIIAFFVLFFLSCCIATISATSKAGKEEKDNSKVDAKTKTPAPASEQDIYQVEVFSKDGALIFVQNFLEEKLKTAASVNIKFTSVASIQKLSDVIPEFSDLMQKNKEKIGTTINSQNVWVVEQEFCDKDNPAEKFSYYALVEFAKGKGYRVISISVGDVQIWPVASK